MCKINNFLAAKRFGCKLGIRVPAKDDTVALYGMSRTSREEDGETAPAAINSGVYRSSGRHSPNLGIFTVPSRVIETFIPFDWWSEFTVLAVCLRLTITAEA